MDPLATNAPATAAAVPAVERDSVRDLILSVLAYGCLYWFVGSLVWLSFAVIEHLVPDPLNQGIGFYDYMVGFSYVVSPDLLASAVVSAIAAVALMRAARRARAVESSARVTRALARVLLYGSLAIVFVVIAGDLVYALRGFFAADLPANAALKAVSVAVFGGLAGWYLLSLRSGFDARSAAFRGRVVGITAGVVTLVLVIYGGLANNSGAASLRDLRADARRVQDLGQIQSDIISHWDSQTGGPASLSALEKEFGLTLPRDPETGAEYGYKVTRVAPPAFYPPLPGSWQPAAGYTFSLCATFAATSTDAAQNGMGYPYYPTSITNFDANGQRVEVSLPEYGWSHGPGEVCFDRTPIISVFPQ